MSDMLPTIVPKTDQLNSDHLIGCTKTIKITRVSIACDQQPVSIYYDGDNGLPWKPCKSMCRVLVQVWGPDANVYVGKSVTLYRDEKVKFGGLEVGGIRISHMSGIDKAMTMALTASKAKKANFIVHPLKANFIVHPLKAEQPKKSAATDLAERYAACPTAEAHAALELERSKLWKSLDAATQKELKAASEAATARITAQSKPPVDFAEIMGQLENGGKLTAFLRGENCTLEDLENGDRAMWTAKIQSFLAAK